RVVAETGLEPPHLHVVRGNNQDVLDLKDALFALTIHNTATEKFIYDFLNFINFFVARLRVEFVWHFNKCKAARSLEGGMFWVRAKNFLPLVVFVSFEASVIDRIRD